MTQLLGEVEVLCTCESWKLGCCSRHGGSRCISFLFLTSILIFFSLPSSCISPLNFYRARSFISVPLPRVCDWWMYVLGERWRKHNASPRYYRANVGVIVYAKCCARCGLHSSSEISKDWVNEKFFISLRSVESYRLTIFSYTMNNAFRSNYTFSSQLRSKAAQDKGPTSEKRREYMGQSKNEGAFGK